MRSETQIVYSIEDNLGVLMDSAGRDSTVVTVEAFGSTLSIPAVRRFASIESIQHYVDLVLALPSVACLNPRGSVHVRKRKGTKRAHYESTGVIAIPDKRFFQSETVVLHEIAHHLGRDSHGPKFRGVLCHLYEVAMSPEAAFYLRASFAEAGLTVTAPKEAA